MIKEAIDFLLELKRPEIVTDDNGDQHIIHGGAYRDLKVAPELPTRFETHTLSGLVGFLNVMNETEDVFINVLSPTNVVVLDHAYDDFNRRFLFADCDMFSRKEFSFGMEMYIERFIIDLRSKFVLDEELKKILSFVSSISQTCSTQADDDGISQTVIKKNEITHRKEMARTDGICKLRPYRTFSEVEQPQINCYLRLTHKKDELPRVTLYEADGGGWKNKAVANIKKWLSERVKVDVVG
jgi:hypothetical protein